MKHFEVKIQWGQEKHPDYIETYKFNTKAELDAFLEGVEEGCGWHEWEIIGDFNE